MKETRLSPVEIKLERRALRDDIRDARIKLAIPKTRGEDVDSWPVTNSGKDAYQAFFSELGISLVHEVSTRKSPVIIDLMSPPTAIRELILSTSDANATGISVALGEHRSAKLQELDSTLNIRHIAGDLMLPRTWRTLEETLKGKKADLIIERGLAGVNCLPKNPMFYMYAMDKIWSMLNPEDGLFLGDTIHAGGVSRSVLWNWIENLADQGIDARYSINTILLRKSPADPATLSELS